MTETPATTPAYALDDPVRVAKDLRDPFRPGGRVYLRAGRQGTVIRVSYDNHRRVWRYVVQIGADGWYIDEADLTEAT